MYERTVSTIKRQATAKSYVILPNDCDIQQLNVSFGAELRVVIDSLHEHLAGTSRRPTALFRGLSLGEISAGERVVQQYRDYIKADIQMQFVVPALEFVVRHILKDDELQGLMEKEIVIEPAPIYEENELENIRLEAEKENLRVTKAQNDNLIKDLESGTPDPPNTVSYTHLTLPTIYSV